MRLLVGLPRADCAAAWGAGRMSTRRLRKPGRCERTSARPTGHPTDHLKCHRLRARSAPRPSRCPGSVPSGAGRGQIRWWRRTGGRRVGVAGEFSKAGGRCAPGAMVVTVASRGRLDRWVETGGELAARRRPSGAAGPRSSARDLMVILRSPPRPWRCDPPAPGMRSSSGEEDGHRVGRADVHSQRPGFRSLRVDIRPAPHAAAQSALGTQREAATLSTHGALSTSGRRSTNPHVDQARMSTGEPGSSRSASIEIDGLSSRTQPWDTARPNSPRLAVPCRAIWPSPVPNWSSTSE